MFSMSKLSQTIFRATTISVLALEIYQYVFFVFFFFLAFLDELTFAISWENIPESCQVDSEPQVHNHENSTAYFVA